MMMKQYLKLLMARERKEVLGRGGANLWLLTLVMVATFASISFSEGSMIYLRDKMEDPFTLWVNISRQSGDNKTSNTKFLAFNDSLESDANKKRFDYNAVISSQDSHFDMIGKQSSSDYLSGRFFENLNTRLIHKVMDEENVVSGCVRNMDLLNDQTMGVILSLGAAKRLGYDENNLPAYISFRSINEGADSLGLRLINNNKYYPVALPVLAVVHRLPNNVQMLSGNFLCDQLEYRYSDPFDFCKYQDDYIRQLVFYVAKGKEKEFDAFVETVIPDSLRNSFSIMDDAGADYAMMRTWKPGTMRRIYFGDGLTSLLAYSNVANAIEDKFSDKTEVCRVFSFETGMPEGNGTVSFLSVEFNSLSHITEFERYAKENGVQLEMEQVHSKQNFDAVSTMAGILSAAMVIFSIVCIIMFMVNMLQSYFQKVQRNIGTFKAFGMSGNELIRVYVIILVEIVAVAVALALLITWGIQGLLPLIGIEKEGYNYFSLWNTTTYVATTVIFVSTVFTVVFVMVRMLSRTPGDLIYERN